MKRMLLWMGLLGLMSGSELVAQTPAGQAPFTMQRSETKIDISQDGKPVASYHVQMKSRPIVWPIYGPDGVQMTRKWPMSEEDATEKKDHPHHKSLWFSHGEVNGNDFWAEPNGHGNVVHKKFRSASVDANKARIESSNEWVAANGDRQLSEERRITFSGTHEKRLIDCEFKLTALDRDVVFGDTKEGTFAIRVAETMKLETKPGGTIENANGERDNATWGKVATWVDYSGPIDGKAYGVAILCHPSTFRSPGRWHVRGYGLFAHNPFGLKDFVGNKDATGGGYTLPKGESIEFHYRLVLHRGDAKQGGIAEAYQAYAATSLEPIVSP
ncbi:MAG: PmoA family protein [Pirellulales bacterium]